MQTDPTPNLAAEIRDAEQELKLATLQADIEEQTLRKIKARTEAERILMETLQTFDVVGPPGGSVVPGRAEDYQPETIVHGRKMEEPK